jgi:hypothetical protein
VKLRPGKFKGMMADIRIIGPDLYINKPRTDPLAFVRPNGEEIALDFEFENDLGSIPNVARIRRRLGKGYYNIAYLFHDAEYAKRELGLPHLSFDEANKLLGEVIITLQQGGYFGQKYDGRMFTAKLIAWATGTVIGRGAWKRALNRKVK